jgi:hypothetical protein
MREDGAKVASGSFDEGLIAAVLKPGTYMLSARKQGAPETAILRVCVPKPVAVASVSPKPGKAWGGEPVEIVLATDGVADRGTIEGTAVDAAVGVAAQNQGQDDEEAGEQTRGQEILRGWTQST